MWVHVAHERMPLNLRYDSFCKFQQSQIRLTHFSFWMLSFKMNQMDGLNNCGSFNDRSHIK